MDGYVIISHTIMWGVITYPYPRHQLLSQEITYKNNDNKSIKEAHAFVCISLFHGQWGNRMTASGSMLVL